MAPSIAVKVRRATLARVRPVTLRWVRNASTASQATRLRMMTIPSQKDGMASPARLNTLSA